MTREEVWRRFNSADEGQSKKTPEGQRKKYELRDELIKNGQAELAQQVARAIVYQ